MIKHLPYNILFASLVSLLFFSAEGIYRFLNPLLVVEVDLKLFGELFITHFLILSLKSKKTMYIAYGIIVALFYVQLLHFAYYGGWIFPLEFYLFFSKFTETVDTFFTILEMALVPTLVSLLLGVALFFTLKKFDANRFSIPYMRYLLIAVLIFLPARVLLANGKHGARPSLNVNIVRNSMESMAYFMGSIVPRKLFPSKELTTAIIESPPKARVNPDVNVIFIIGETLANSHMSMYGYERDTTPKLNKYIGSENFFFTQGYAAGVCTDVSIPSLINVIEKPDGLPQIVSANTCLFSLAKANGFHTSFYSAQSPEGLKHIKGYICMSEIDELLDSTPETKKQVDNNAYDEILIERLDKVDFTQPNFLVLHQIGSHSPHEWRYPKEFEKYVENQESGMKKNIDYYDNSVLYTDYVLSEIMKYVGEHSDKETYVVFTSDHATVLDKEGVRGHGKLSEDAIFKVPFFVKAFNSDGKALEELQGIDKISHFEVSKLLEKLLGYRVDKVMGAPNGYYVCGRDIEGYDGYAQLLFDENSTKKRIITP